MGRKIPGKKHRTIKDPYKQIQKRLERSKVDNPPSNADEQEIPKSLLEIMELKRKAKQTYTKNNIKKNKKKSTRKRPVLLSVAQFLDKEPTPKGVSKPEKYIPNIVQKPYESTKSFLGRVSSMTQSLVSEVEFEKKFGIEIKKDPTTGKVVEIKKIKKKHKNKKKLSEKRKEKLKQKKEKVMNVAEFSQMKDIVEFGEVVHRPPDLTLIKKQKMPVQKPIYSDLLLNNFIKNVPANTKTVPSTLEREKAEIERNFIVEAYRKHKKLQTDS